MDLRGQGSCLPDMPPEPFPDKTVLWDSDALTRQGVVHWSILSNTGMGSVWWERWDFISLHAPHLGHLRPCVQELDEDFRQYCAMSIFWLRAGFCKPCPGQFWGYPIVRALISLGLAQPLLDLEKLLKLLDSDVLVAIGPFASQFWQRGPAGAEAKQHTHGFCAFCNEFCLHATCEHMHAAFLILGRLSLQRPVFLCFVLSQTASFFLIPIWLYVFFLISSAKRISYFLFTFLFFDLYLFFWSFGFVFFISFLFWSSSPELPCW